MFYIGIITYNRRNTIKKAIDSIISQLPEDDSVVIVVDDGSTDGTGEFIFHEYAQYIQLGKLVYSYHDNGGINFSRYEAVEMAKKLHLSSNEQPSPYFLFCDSDDWLNSNALTIIANHLKKYSEYVIHAFPWVDSFGKIISSNKAEGYFTYEQIISGKLMEGPDFHMVFRLDKIGDAQFQEDLRWGDGYFFEELVANYGLVLSTYSTYIARITDSSITRKWQDMNTINDLYQSELRRHRYIKNLPSIVQSQSLLKAALYSGIIGKKIAGIRYIYSAIKLGARLDYIWLLFSIIGLLPFSLLFYNVGNYLYQKKRII